jgi:FKBP-type peptidyl-prolyl cis-trans isomerase SlyD
MRTFRITEVTPDSIQLDANHPLAGQDLIFELHVLEARDATAEEIYESIGTELPRYLH